EEFMNELDQLFPTIAGHREPSQVHCKVLRCHPSRCVFNLAIKLDDQWQNVIVKLFTSERLDVFSNLQRIYGGGFGQGAEFVVPRPIAYIPSLKMIIEEKIEGKPASETLIGEDLSDQVEAVGRAGAWLAQFHTRAPKFGNQVEPEVLLEHSREWAERVSKFGKGFPSKCKLLVEKLEASMPKHGSFHYSPGHGNYIPSHVILDDPRTAVIDLDGFDLVDPARDLAWFTINVERYGLKHDRPPGYFERLNEPFLRSYLKRGGEDVLNNLPFYKGVEYLHRAKRDLYKKIPPEPNWAEMMLDHAIQGL
ncbi:phosphotransferase, partial [Candidatus Bathyarchaeota archaeon]|nr:phosphotransferase [Candidatus Bathyarchaeota archaeon]